MRGTWARRLLLDEGLLRIRSTRNGRKMKGMIQ
jgi:hypothetical protein